MRSEPGGFPLPRWRLVPSPSVRPHRSAHALAQALSEEESASVFSPNLHFREVRIHPDLGTESALRAEQGQSGAQPLPRPGLLAGQVPAPGACAATGRRGPPPSGPCEPLRGRVEVCAGAAASVLWGGPPPLSAMEATRRARAVSGFQGHRSPKPFPGPGPSTTPVSPPAVGGLPEGQVTDPVQCGARGARLPSRPARAPTCFPQGAPRPPEPTPWGLQLCRCVSWGWGWAWHQGQGTSPFPCAP